MNIQWEGERAPFAKAMVAAQKATEAVYKANTNPAFKSKYADLAAVVEAIVPALNNCGIAVIQAPGFDGEMVTVETTFLHESGSAMSSVMTLRPSKLDPQGVGAAVTYGRRYALLAMAGGAPEDDDGNAASGHAEPARKSAAQAKKDGDWDRIIAAIEKCRSEAQLDAWWVKMEPHWTMLPFAWKDAAANEVEKHRNAILDDALIAEARVDSLVNA
jgi:hypothetical protein